MTTVDEELQAVEETLKKCAQQLGRLNLDNNKLLEGNEDLSMQIKKLQAKIAKKNHVLEQEAKDKQIIHQKLVKAEEVKQQLEIRGAKDRERREKQKEREEYEMEMRRKEEEFRAQQKKKEESQQQQKQQVKVPDVKKDVPQVKVQNPKASSPPVEAQTPAPKIEGQSKSFQNAEKGQYEPPALFFEDNEEQESDQEGEEDEEEDNSKMLEKMRQKLRQERQELEQD